VTGFSPIALSLPQAALRVSTNALQSPVPAKASTRVPAAREIDPAERPSVEQAIATASRSTSVDFDFLVAQARVESSMNPQARARTSSATGLYQFIESTWLDTMKRHGARFGLEEVAAQIKTTPGGTAYVRLPASAPPFSTCATIRKSLRSWRRASPRITARI
jgi:soluble lytic murein transglycosylase-like protein